MALSASGSLEIRRLGEMAEAAALVWLRSPSFGCKAVWCASAPRSVRDFIHLHCQDQVRFVVPGRNGKAGQGPAVRVCRGHVYSLGFSVFEAEG